MMAENKIDSNSRSTWPRRRGFADVFFKQMKKLKEVD